MNKIKNNIGYYIVILLSLFPLVLWYFQNQIQEKFSSLAQTMVSLGQMAGLVGMALFSCTLILSGRFKFLEDYFGGLNKMYIYHHLFGSIAFILLVFHPLIFATRYFLFSARDAALFLLPSYNWPVNFGKMALLLMMIFLFITFFIKLPYHIWKFTHKFMGLAFFFAGLHVFFIPSDVSQNSALRAYMLGLAGISLSVYIYRTILGKFAVKKFTYMVENMRQINDAVVEIAMSPQKNTMNFLAGQFIFIRFLQEGISREFHPFSITSIPNESILKISVKSLGDYTSQLKNLREGALAKIEGPFGKFSYQNYPNKNQIWIAGGIGITPFLSMARTLANSDYSIALYYSAKTKNEAAYLNELLEIAKNKSNFKIFPYITDTQGFLTAEIVAKTSGDPMGKEIFLCCPQAMSKALKNQLHNFKIKNRHIHTDEFFLS